MIIFSKALADQATVWEALRASDSEACENLPPDLVRFSGKTRPVVMWNLTSSATWPANTATGCRVFREELTLEAYALIDDLADLGRYCSSPAEASLGRNLPPTHFMPEAG
jgi:hypothetical protein